MPRSPLKCRSGRTACRSVLTSCGAQALLVVSALFWMLVIEVLPPRWGEFCFYLVLCVPVGLGLSFWRHKVKQHKAENIEKVQASFLLDLRAARAPSVAPPIITCREMHLLGLLCLSSLISAEPPPHPGALGAAIACALLPVVGLRYAGSTGR